MLEALEAFSARVLERAGHRSQTSCPASSRVAYVSALQAQSTSAMAPSPRGVVDCGGQFWHTFCLGEDAYVPAAQTLHEPLRLAAWLNPFGQSVQDVDPSRTANRPASQSTQLAAPSRPLLLPSAQILQAEDRLAS